MKIRIKVDEDLCIGAASCVTIKPDVFQLNAENKAIVLDPEDCQTETYERWLEVTQEQYEQILLAAQSCPTLAIFLFDESGKQLFPEF
ncbi:ferredoxin [Candidatus Uhrbacteria bacterium]|nr:ferredoxin [Candidatus Uhrbacteria bacterium]